MFSCSRFQSRFFHIHWYCPHRTFKRSTAAADDVTK